MSRLAIRAPITFDWFDGGIIAGHSDIARLVIAIKFDARMGQFVDEAQPFVTDQLTNRSWESFQCALPTKRLNTPVSSKVPMCDTRRGFRDSA